jgi:thiamine biosynthesis protein ThiI
MSGTSLVTPAELAAPAAPRLGEPCVLLKLGEIVLKGANRQQFERLLNANIRRAMAYIGVSVRIWHRYGVILLRAGDGRNAEVAAAADTIPEQSGDMMEVARV